MTRYDDFKPRDDKRPERFATIGDLFKNIRIEPGTYQHDELVRDVADEIAKTDEIKETP